MIPPTNQRRQHQANLCQRLLFLSRTGWQKSITILAIRSASRFSVSSHRLISSQIAHCEFMHFSLCSKKILDVLYSRLTPEVNQKNYFFGWPSTCPAAVCILNFFVWNSFIVVAF